MSQVQSITELGTSPAQDRARRQKTYLYSMGLRSLFFVTGALAALAGLNWLWPILMGLAFIIPYFAVVAANGRTSGKTVRPTSPSERLPVPHS